MLSACQHGGARRDLHISSSHAMPVFICHSDEYTVFTGRLPVGAQVYHADGGGARGVCSLFGECRAALYAVCY